MIADAQSDDGRPSLAELRHTAAHVLAYAVQDLFPDAKPTIGPAIENGFYYDFDRGTPFTPEDLTRLEARMHEIVEADYPMTGREVSRGDAVGAFPANPYKVEMASEIPEGQPITLYTIGAFTDLCRGGHADSTGKIGAFKLTGLAGAYWRGDEHNAMLQRIYGTAWYTQDDLDAHLHRLEEAQRRDHRKLGAELDLFSIEEEAGGGLVFWHPKGAIVRGLIEDFIREGLRERGYLPVVTPHIVSERLYEISGHLENFSENMFGPIEVETQRFRLKPMNCPGHILIYKNRLRSYRDLPLRFSEFGTVYRFERSGVLHGLTRVRGFTQDDAHLFCTPDQLQGEFERTLDEALRLMKAFGFNEFQYVLSTRDQAARGETDSLAEQAIRQALQRYELSYEIDEGGGAFYGPKLDVNVRDALGRPWQLGTVQVDFVLPARFGLKYRAADGQDHQPVMIHRALAGSLERFFGILVEHYGGAFPVWLAPIQVVVTAISQHQAAYAQEVASRIRGAGFRVELDENNEKLGYKIRHWKTQKVPYILVAGKQEVAEGTVNVNERGIEEKRTILVDTFIDDLHRAVEAKL
ncbi:MAG TPA: threonine--tRNA ligase [Candidatus Baltobacteraceae bacterium]|jgi:threonyl-tRNA synthetase|nr:threonine--tRNA ligase [Candidatus Baltobacteraceae bacterium]